MYQVICEVCKRNITFREDDEVRTEKEPTYFSGSASIWEVCCPVCKKRTMTRHLSDRGMRDYRKKYESFMALVGTIRLNNKRNRFFAEGIEGGLFYLSELLDDQGQKVDKIKTEMFSWFLNKLSYHQNRNWVIQLNKDTAIPFNYICDYCICETDECELHIYGYAETAQGTINNIEKTIEKLQELYGTGNIKDCGRIIVGGTEINITE